jgi:hypothetical protein
MYELYANTSHNSSDVLLVHDVETAVTDLLLSLFVSPCGGYNTLSVRSLHRSRVLDGDNVLDISPYPMDIIHSG